MVRAMIDLAVWPVLTVSDYLLFFITLLTLFSPPAAIAAFATITDRFPPDIQKKVAKRLARNYFVVMLFSLTIGEYLLMVLGISTPALMLTGGLAVFIAGMPMMVYGQKLQVVRNEDEFHAVPRAEWESVVSVPMTFPMAVGGLPSP
jgi:multiple antibiotic resistance protein